MTRRGSAGYGITLSKTKGPRAFPRNSFENYSYIEAFLAYQRASFYATIFSMCHEKIRKLLTG